MTRRALLLLFCGLLLACRPQSPPQLDAQRLHVSVTESGVYRLTLAQMQAAGLAVDALSADALALSADGQPIPYLLLPDALVFYAAAPTDRYTAVRSYVLTAGESGIEMTAVSAAPGNQTPTGSQVRQTLLLEENRVYESRAVDAADRWFWQRIGQEEEMVVLFALPGAGDGGGALHLRLWGASRHAQIEPDHDLDVWVNGRFIDTVRWDGSQAYTVTLALPPQTLRAGPNELLLDNRPPGSAPLDVMLLDQAVVAYHAPPVFAAPFAAVVDRQAISLADTAISPLLLDVSDPTRPRQLTGWQRQDGQIVLRPPAGALVLAVDAAALPAPQTRLMRASAWRQPAAGADFIIIAAEEVWPALEPLRAARTNEGLRVALLSPQEIYDAFGAGQASPRSVRRFLQHAATEWPPPAPRYVLLVGDATWDYRGYVDAPPPYDVPALMAPVAHGGETVSDGRLADVDGDGLPQLAVGRWPVRSRSEVRALAARTLAYDAVAYHRASAVLVDGSEPTFARMAERIWAGGGFPATVHSETSAGAGLAAWPEDVWLGAYVGHGSLDRWGAAGLLTADNLARAQRPFPPILLQFTCLTGLFAHPTQPALSEQLLHLPQGPVAVVAATSLTLSAAQEPFAQRLTAALHDPANLRLGDAFLQAMRGLDVSDPAQQEVVDTFTLFADPTLGLQRP